MFNMVAERIIRFHHATGKITLDGSWAENQQYYHCTRLAAAVNMNTFKSYIQVKIMEECSATRRYP